MPRLADRVAPGAAAALHSAILLQLVLAAGCAAGPVGGPAPAGEAEYVRHVAPFEVLDAGGEPYEFPFLGGLNVPRPQFVDIDGDGDLDLFLQERSDEVVFFENTGSAAAPAFTWRTDKFRGLDVGEWFRFVDMDADGDPDLLTEQPFSLIRYFRNDAGRFVLAADTLRGARGEAIFSDRQNIPNVTDIDCDGRPDLFIGRLTGTVTHYEATAPVGEAMPAFGLVTDRFENIEIVAQIGSMHGANTMVFADVDGDGDEDLFWGDFFEPGILFIRNTGSCAAPALRGAPIPFPPNDPVRTSGFNVPAVADLDGDGDPDILMGVLGGAYNPNRTAADNLFFLENRDGVYSVRTRRFLGTIDLGAECVVALGDLDGDGDLDILAASKLDPAVLTESRIVRFENTGTPTRPAFRLADTLGIGGSYHFAPELADLDGDGDLDLVVGEAAGTLNLYRNVGTAREPRFELVSDEYGRFDVGRRSAPSFADLDGDGDPDLVVGHEGGGPTCFRNDAGELAPMACPLPDLLPMAAPRLADLDGDGDLDLLAGTLGGGITFHENRGR